MVSQERNTPIEAYQNLTECRSLAFSFAHSKGDFLPNLNVRRVPGESSDETPRKRRMTSGTRGLRRASSRRRADKGQKRDRTLSLRRHSTDGDACLAFVIERVAEGGRKIKNVTFTPEGLSNISIGDRNAIFARRRDC